MTLRIGAPILTLLFLLAGCSTSSVQTAPQPDLAVPLQNPGMARIYLIRSGDTYSENKQVHVVDGETYIGALGRGFYLVWERPAKITQLKYFLDTGARVEGKTEGFFALEPEAGAVYYLEVSFPMPSRRAETKQLMPEYGKKLIGERKPAPEQK